LHGLRRQGTIGKVLKLRGRVSGWFVGESDPRIGRMPSKSPFALLQLSPCR